jgi:hypothetical protein
LSKTIGEPGVIDAHGSAGGAGDGDGNDLADRLHAGLGVEGHGSLHVPLALAAGADVLLGAANLSFGRLAISKTAWNVAAMSMVSVPGMELASLAAGHLTMQDATRSS